MGISSGNRVVQLRKNQRHFFITRMDGAQLAWLCFSKSSSHLVILSQVVSQCVWSGQECIAFCWSIVVHLNEWQRKNQDCIVVVIGEAPIHSSLAHESAVGAMHFKRLNFELEHDVDGQFSRISNWLACWMDGLFSV